MDLYRNTLIDLPSDRLLQRRALAVAAFKARVDTAGLTRPVRADAERAFLTQSRRSVALALRCAVQIKLNQTLLPSKKDTFAVHEDGN